MKGETVLISSIEALLKNLHLEGFQKHKYFHIVSFQKDFDTLSPTQFHVQSENYFEVTLTRTGGDKISIDGVKYTAEGSQLTFLSPGQSIHIDSHDHQQEKEGYLIFFTNDFLNIAPTNFNLIKQFPYFHRNFSPIYSLTKLQSNRFLDLMDEIYARFQTPTPDEFEIIKAYLTIILFEAKKIIENTSDYFHSRAEEITYRFENLLRKSKKRLVRDFASDLYISPIYLSECVKATTGKSAKQVITEYKIWEAKSFLSLTEESVDTIAELLGFDDRSNFINFFKKNVGKTPSIFRKTHSK